MPRGVKKVIEYTGKAAKAFEKVQKLEADLKEKKVNYNNNPITKWCLLNTSIKIDDNDNIRPVKGKKSRQRIDGAVSLIDAYVVLYRKMQDYLAMQEE